MPGPLVPPARDHPEQLRLKLGHAPVEPRPARLEQVRDRLGAGGLAGVGVGQADAQARVGGMHGPGGLDPSAAARQAREGASPVNGEV